MIDRMDIDALLVSALYGELTPADEARLTAHLESHPADRTALADLTHTRATIRESRILTFQFEPPQSVSALLLQEAARRAPKPRGEVAGWFHRFTRSFMMHPAMAAAAMLVLVVGVAGTLYVRHGDPFVEMAPVATTDQSMASAAQPKSEPETTTVATETGRADDSKNRGAEGTTGAAAGSAGYRVGLDEPADPPKLAVRDELQTSAGRAKGGKSAVVANDGKDDGQKDDSQKDDGDLAKRGWAYEASPAQLAKQEGAAPRPAKPTRLAKEGDLAGAGIELRSRELEPKDFDDEQRDQKADKPSKKASSNRKLDLADAEGDRVSAADKVQQVPATGAGGGAATVAPGMIPPQAHAAAPGPAADPAAAPPPAPAAVTAVGASSSPSNVTKFKASEKTVSRSAPQGQAPSPQPSPPPPPAPAVMAAAPPSSERDNRRSAGKPATPSVDTKPAADAKLAQDKPTDDKAVDKAVDKALIDWAQKQRDQVLALVKSNNCRAAANAAVEIYNRAPDYYAANIATDRSIKPCIAYVNDVRERADRRRAMKRANTVDTPAQAAPPPARK